MRAKGFARAMLKSRSSGAKKEGFCVVDSRLPREEQVAQWRLEHEGFEPSHIIAIERFKQPLPMKD